MAVRAGKEPREWGIELVPNDGAPPSSVRVWLIDRETGQRIGSRSVPWEWFRGIATGETITINVANGVHE